MKKVSAVLDYKEMTILSFKREYTIHLHRNITEASKRRFARVIAPRCTAFRSRIGPHFHLYRIDA